MKYTNKILYVIKTKISTNKMKELLLEYEDAKKLVLKHIKPLKNEMCHLEKSQGRAISKNIYATYSMPLFDNSAVDGYAVKYFDLVNASNKNPVLF